MENYELTEALKEKLEKAESTEEMAAILVAEGIEVTKEQLESLAAENGELNENALEDVAGGCIRPIVHPLVVKHVAFFTRLVHNVVHHHRQ